MTTAPSRLQDLQRRIYAKAKAEPAWRFWGLYVHVGTLETLRTAYAAAKANHGAPGIDGVTFAAIEASGVEAFLQQLRDALVSRTDSAPAVPAAGDSEGEWPQGQNPLDPDGGRILPLLQ
jgi:RNA-directed DNA polymerase